MRKNEIKNATNGELIVEYVTTYTDFVLNQNERRGTKVLAAHSKDLEHELIARGILTQEQVDELNK